MSDLHARIIINAITDGLHSGLDKAASGLNNLRKQVNDTMNSMQGAFASLGLGALAHDILQTNREMESLRMQLESVTGSVEKGVQAFNDMLQLATDTPFEIKDLASAYVMLKNFGLEPTAEVMNSLTNQVSKLGGGSDALSGITLALGQAWSKGKLQAEEINQMVERGVPIYSLLAKVTGKQSIELLNMAENGEITREVLEKLIAKMGEMSSGSNARAMDTLNGKISVLSDSWHKFEDTLLQDKSEGFLKKIVSNWGEWLDFFAAKLDSVGSKFIELEQINERIATRKHIIDMLPEGMSDRYQKKLDADLAAREKLITSIHEEKQVKKEADGADAKALADSKALAKTQADMAEHSKHVAEWSEKYANNTQKLASELAKAKQELGADFTPELEAAITAKFSTKNPKAHKAPKTPKAAEESEIHGFDFGLEQQKIAFERSNALLDFSKEAEKAYWDNIIANYKGNAKTLADLKKKSADLELSIIRDNAKKKQDLQKETIDSEHAAALDELGIKEAASQQELDLGNITQEQHLANLRNFAAERLAIEQKLLDDKRALLGDDALALAQNLHQKQALERASAAKLKAIDNQEKLSKKEHFKQMLAPFTNALEQMTNGILTGQQTVKKAIQNVAQSMVVSYATSFIKTGALAAASWAWELTGFGAKETAKVGIKGASEGIQTAEAGAGASAREGIEIMAAARSSIRMAWLAAKGAFSSVMAWVPFPLNVVLAPIAGAAAFMGTMALGSAKGGEWQVGKDGSPYILHEKESVLPAGVAENFRKVVGIVNGHVEAPNHIAVIDELFASGKIAKNLALPGFALNMAAQSQSAANALVRDRVYGDSGGSSSSKSGGDHFHIHGIAMAPEQFFKQNSKTIVKVAKDEARKFNTGKR
jgi:tape measure domain-containing protein